MLLINGYTHAIQGLAGQKHNVYQWIKNIYGLPFLKPSVAALALHCASLLAHRLPSLV